MINKIKRYLCASLALMLILLSVKIENVYAEKITLISEGGIYYLDGKKLEGDKWGVASLEDAKVEKYLSFFNTKRLKPGKLTRVPRQDLKKQSAGFWYRDSEGTITWEGRQKYFIFIAEYNLNAKNSKGALKIRDYKGEKTLDSNEFFIYVLARKDYKSKDFKYFFSEKSVIGGGPVEEGHPKNHYEQNDISEAQTGNSTIQIFTSGLGAIVNSAMRSKILEDLMRGGFDDKSYYNKPTLTMGDLFGVKNTPDAFKGKTLETSLRRIYLLSNDNAETRERAGHSPEVIKGNLHTGMVVNNVEQAKKVVYGMFDTAFFDFSKVEFKYPNGDYSVINDLKFGDYTQPQKVKFPNKDMPKGTLIRFSTRTGSINEVNWYNPDMTKLRYIYFKVAEDGTIKSLDNGSKWGENVVKLNSYVSVAADGTISTANSLPKDVKEVNVYERLEWHYDVDKESILTLKPIKHNLKGSSIIWPKGKDDTERSDILVEIVLTDGTKIYYILNSGVIEDGRINEDGYGGPLKDEVAEHEEFKSKFIPNKTTYGKLSSYLELGKDGKSLSVRKGINLFQMEFKKASGKAYAFVPKGGSLKAINKSAKDAYYLAYVSFTKTVNRKKIKIYSRHTVFKVPANTEFDLGYLNSEVAMSYKEIQSFLNTETNNSYLTLDVYNSSLNEVSQQVDLLTNFKAEHSSGKKVFKMDPAWIMYMLKDRVGGGNNYNDHNFYFPVTEIEVLMIDNTKKKSEKGRKTSIELKTTIGDTKKSGNGAIIVNYKLDTPGKSITFPVSDKQISKTTSMALKVSYRYGIKRLGHEVGVYGDASKAGDGKSNGKTDDSGSNRTLLYVVKDFKSNSPKLERVSELPDEFEDDSIDFTAEDSSISRAIKVKMNSVSSFYNDTDSTTELTYVFTMSKQSSSNALLIPYYTGINAIGSFMFNTNNSNTKDVSGQLGEIAKFFDYNTSYKWHKIDLKFDNRTLYAFDTSIKPKDGFKKFTVHAKLKGIKLSALKSNGQFTTNAKNLFGIKFIVIEGGKIRLLDPN